MAGFASLLMQVNSNVRGAGQTMNRTLYSGTRNASSWAFRAWLALKEANVHFEEVVVDIRKPQRFANLARIAEFSPPGAVPVLVDGATVIFDSLAIMEYANDLSGGQLLPKDLKARAHARALASWQHAGLSGLCPRLSFESSFYHDRRPMSDDESSESERIFRVFEHELSQSNGPYLVGELSLADLCFVPSVLRLISHMPSLEPWPLTSAWTMVLLDRPAVKEWLAEANALPPVLLDDYRVRA
jgi:glutathione S-transferase